MAQKANPISLRLQYTNRFFDNNWYSKKYYDKLVVKDIHIQKYINTFLKLLKLPLSRLSIQHIPQKTRIFSFFCYPKLSRNRRSKMFGVYVPHFFKQKNKWVSQTKKYNCNLLETQSKLKNFKTTENKLVYNNNIMNHSLFNLMGIWKPYLCSNQVLKKNFDGKIEKWAKNLFFVTYYSNLINRNRTPNNSNISQLLQVKNQKLHFYDRSACDARSACQLEMKSQAICSTMKTKMTSNDNYNKFFLKFIINLVIQNKFKKKKRDGNKDIKNVELQNIEMKPLLNYFLILNKWNSSSFYLNTVEHTISTHENKVSFYSSKTPYDTLKKFTLFNTKLYNYLNTKTLKRINDKGNSDNSKLYKETHQNRIVLNHSTSSKTLKTNQALFRVAGHLSHEITGIKSKKQANARHSNFIACSSNSKLTSTTRIQQILGILPQKKISLLENNFNVVSDFNLIHGFSSFDTKEVLSIDNTWKLNTLETQYKYKNYIQRSLAGQYNVDFEFIPFKIKNDWQNAGFLADEIVYFVERRVQFRRFKNKLLHDISRNSNIRGIRITCSGRVGGKSKKAQRAKTECVKLGQTSLHVFSNQIDFASRTAHTSFGSVGIKVWISYNS